MDSTGVHPGRRDSDDVRVPPGPNQEVLEAQARVCTGPRQVRPLGLRTSDPDPSRILQIILSSIGVNETEYSPVSPSQLGAFFAAMTLRKTFHPPTSWSPAEKDAFDQYGSLLRERLPPEISFLLEPGSSFAANFANAETVTAALRTILAGGHLSYDQTRCVLEAILSGDVPEALAAAVLIGQRMNLENAEEARAYLEATNVEVIPVELDSLTHLGEPYDGATRYFRPSVFVAAVRAALGRPTVLHGVDSMPPKWGITDEQVLNVCGARTDVTSQEARGLLEDVSVGWAYVSQREYAPALYACRHLRHHIKKRPPWAATEKVQRLFRCGANDFMVVGIYHSGYDDLLLRLMRESELTIGMVTKGEEGSSFYSLRGANTSSRSDLPINYSRGFRRGNKGEEFSLAVEPRELGFDYESNPRPVEVSAGAFADSGWAALHGIEGHEFDRIALNVGMMDHLLGFVDDPLTAVQQARTVMKDGSAAARFQAYIDRSTSC